jgi:hypothetical protein
MLTELLNNVNSDIARGMAQAAGAIVLCLAVDGHIDRPWPRADGVRGHRLGRAAARKLAGRRHDPVGHDLYRCGNGFAARPGHPRLAVIVFLRNCRWGRRRYRGNACHGDAHDRHISAGAGGEHDHRQRNECLRAIRRTIQGRRDGARGLYRGGVGAWRRPCSSDSALFPERGLRELTSPSRHAEISRFGLDTGRDGRNDGVGRQSRLRGNIPIRHRGNDPGRVGHYWIGRDAADENACFLDCRAIDNPSRH